MYKKSEQSFFKCFDFIILDSIMLQIAFTISYFLRHGFHNPYEIESYRQLAFVMGIFLILVTFIVDGYNDILQRGYLIELKQSVKVISIVSVFVVLYLFVLQNSSIYSRYVVFMIWLIGSYLIYMEHIIWKSVLIRKIRNGVKQREVLLIATNAKMAQKVIEHFEEWDACDFHVVKLVLLQKNSLEQIHQIPVMYDLKETIEYISENVIDEVMICTTSECDVPEFFVEDCLNMGVVVHQDLKEKIPTGVHQEVSQLGDYVVLTSCMKSVTSWQLFLKRTIDIVGSFVGLVLTGIAFLFVAPIIKIQSPGPIVFKQTRVGKNGRHFDIYKFRSMYMDAEERKKELMKQNKMSGPISKFENDPRIFPFGRFIRKYSIDELPQFFNVLKGDMSLVGTRPPTVDEYEQYELHHKKRLAAKPGLTGMWQVSGRSDISDFEDIIRLDAQYISEWRILLDIKIICHTILVVLRKKGAE